MAPLCNDPFYWQSETGSTEAFLLLHGLGGGCYEMRPLAEQLHQAGYTVAGINYPGHDHRAYRMPGSTWQQWYNQAEEAYRDLCQHYKRVIPIGFSTGCLLALHLAASVSADMPVAGLILLSPFFKIRKAWYYLLSPERYLRPLSRFLWQVPRKRLPIRDKTMHDEAVRLAHFRTFNLRSVTSAMDLIGIVREELPAITSPTLVIQSRRDHVVCPSGAELLMQHLDSRYKQIHWLEHSDHILMLDIEREQVSQLIFRFIDELERTGGEIRRG